LKFSLCDVVGVNILDPRAVECIVSPSPKRIDKGNEGGLPIKLLERKPGSKEAMIVGRDVFGRSLWFAKVVIGGRDGIGAAGPIGG
jgi:hypothetical protein